eukprot:scaffold367903_cov16-Prasinocladus_malaysianus.AAC.1
MLYSGQGGYHLQQSSIGCLSTADSADLPYFSELFAGVAVAAQKLVALEPLFPSSIPSIFLLLESFLPHQINGLVGRLIIIAADVALFATQSLPRFACSVNRTTSEPILPRCRTMLTTWCVPCR